MSRCLPRISAGWQGSALEAGDWRIVKSMGLFASMPGPVVERLVAGGVRAHAKGTRLFEQGATATAFYVVVEGWVKVFRLSADGEEVVIGVFSRGESFAEAAMFMGGRYPASAEVVSPSRLIRVEGQVLRERILETPELAFCMLASASRHLHLLVEQVELIKVMSAPRRVAEFLLRLCSAQEGACAVELPYEKALIARRLGMKPESFSRALAKLRPCGVTVERDRVHIAEVRSLSAMARCGESAEDRLTAH
jgi:CRP/FNR family transcriptional regulator, dissimilatory nitrate respiration regulator